MINKVFTILFWDWDTLCLTFLRVCNPVKALPKVISKVASSSQEVLYKNFVTCITVSKTAVNILEIYL